MTGLTIIFVMNTMAKKLHIGIWSLKYIIEIVLQIMAKMIDGSDTVMVDFDRSKANDEHATVVERKKVQTVDVDAFGEQTIICYQRAF